MNTKELISKIELCQNCPLSSLQINKRDLKLGYGKLLPFYGISHENKVMLVGLNPSYRRFPGIYCAFGGDVKHSGTGDTFISLLVSLNLIDKVYITNLIKCSCSDNKPIQENYEQCFKIFSEEVNLVKPTKIIALGKNVYNFLIKYQKYGITYIPHPVFWSAYNKISTKDYSQLLCKTIIK